MYFLQITLSAPVNLLVCNLYFFYTLLQPYYGTLPLPPTPDKTSFSISAPIPWRKHTEFAFVNFQGFASHGDKSQVTESETYPDPFHHEADVADAHEVRALIDGINGLDVAGDLNEWHTDSV